LIALRGHVFGQSDVYSARASGAYRPLPRSAFMNEFVLKVGLLGLPRRERDALNRILRLSSSRRRSYSMVDPSTQDRADILIVDSTDQKALQVWRNIRAVGNGVPALMVEDQAVGENPHYVRRPLLAMRVLNALDRLPALATDAPPAAGAAGGANVGQSSPGTSHRALVVDDSLPVRTQIEQELRRAGVQVRSAKSGEEAMKHLADETYDVIFLDVVMPGMDGYEVCKKVKRDKHKKHIPVVMLTSKSSPFDKVRGKLCGCDAYLAKPVSREEFDKALGKVLKPAFATSPAPGHTVPQASTAQ